MSGRSYRLPVTTGGPVVGRVLDRNTRLGFTFDGRSHIGYKGDTVASALLANGVRVVGRSFKYHRPRGLFSAGTEEPNGVVTIGTGNRMTPNIHATGAEIHDGLVARSQNRWPSLATDIGQITGWASRFIPAGFYYKTFMWPAAAWPVYERFIRRASGLGPPPKHIDPDTYEQIHVACDVLVAGGGVAGLAAARAAAQTGARVILADNAPRLGGSADICDGMIDGAPVVDWARGAVAELAARDNVHLLTRTTVAGHYFHNYLMMAERLTDHQPDLANEGVPRERLWKVRAGQVIVATGAIERGLTFANNDRPGIMLASAARIYAARYGVSPGGRGVVFTNNDDAYRTAILLAGAGVSIGRLVDTRAAPDGKLIEAARALGIEITTGAGIANVKTSLGGMGIEAVEVAKLRGDGRAGDTERVECDFVCVSGGWTPAAHLSAHSGGRLGFDEDLGTLRPMETPKHMHIAGAANAMFTLKGALAQGYRAGDIAGRAAQGQAKRRGKAALAEKISETAQGPAEPIWFVPATGRLAEGIKHFVDLQHDVTAADIELGVREGYRSVEHLKRYTALGMAPDQGKTGNVNGLAIQAAALGVTIADLGVTTFRPPFTPVTFGAIAGSQAGQLFQPVRRTPLTLRHEALGADFEPVGLWRRPYCYGAPALSRAQAVRREIRNTRANAGLLDASTLGKIEVRGRHAGKFLDLIYAGVMSSLKPGRCRYGLMLNEQGFVFDDGVVARLGEDRFLLHTTSGGADHVGGWLERWHQTEWPDMDLFITPVTEQWAQVGIAGPRARDVLLGLDSDIDFAPEAFPHLDWRPGRIEGIETRVFRVSFSGELSYEVACPAGFGAHLWDALMAAGEEFGIAPYGTEALHVMRAEKGFIAIGDETDGTVTPLDLGLGWAVSKKKQDFLGKRGLECADLARQGRWQLVGLQTADPACVLPDGAYLTDADHKDQLAPYPTIGFVTSTYMSPTLARSIALALVENGASRHGERIYARVGSGGVETEIVDPVFYDRDGSRQNG